MVRDLDRPLQNLCRIDLQRCFAPHHIVGSNKSMPIEQYQNLIIGSGEAGKCIGWALAQSGQKTIVIEKSMIGGSCPNIACLPSKNVIYSAKAASFAARGAEFGIETAATKIDMARVVLRKREMVDALIQIHLNKFRDSGAELCMGNAKFVEPKTVEVSLNAAGTRTIRGERVFINTGSRASIPNVPGLVESKPLTHVEMLDLPRLAAHLVVLGGGYIGLEFAQAMRRFGSRVTVIQHGPQLLADQDADIAQAMQKFLEEDGLEILLSTELLKVTGTSGQSVKLSIRSATGERTVDATDILVAAGRTPNTDRIAIHKAGVELTPRGFIQVNEKLQTTAADIWATGDCAGSPHFTHVGYDDYRVVMSNLSGGNRTTRDRLIPFGLFTDPELAHVGLSEKAAKAKGISYRLAKLPMISILRTRTTSETRGFIKALIATDSDRILGFTALGAEASELSAAVQTAMLGDMPYTTLRDAIFTHPTTAEGLTLLLAAVPAR
jgi:pyruvate/2-oxoglutarate dehydrogenase complex dihydrolipoamide dehydrogenase (E3) component